MGYVIIAIAFGWMLITQSMTTERAASQQVIQSDTASKLLAGDMLRLANAVNSWRYSHTLAEGPLSLTQFGLIPTPDPQLHAVIQAGRLWIWSADTPGLFSALRQRSTGSSLTLRVSAGRLRMSDGTDMNLALPSGLPDGNVVYLN
jgi:hypothetical protein